MVLLLLHVAIIVTSCDTVQIITSGEALAFSASLVSQQLWKGIVAQESGVIYLELDN